MSVVVHYVHSNDRLRATIDCIDYDSIPGTPSVGEMTIIESSLTCSVLPVSRYITLFFEVSRLEHTIFTVVE